MKPLSPFKYFLKNKKRMSVITIILLLAVAVVAFVTSVVNSIIISASDGSLKPFEYVSAVSTIPGEFYLKKEIIDKINNYEALEKSVNVIIEDTSYAALMGNTNVPIYFTENDVDIADLIKIYKLTLAEGDLPKANEHEIVLHDKIMKNKGLKVGDYIGSDVNENEFLSGKYKIVGSLTGDVLTGIGSRSIVADTYKDAGLKLDLPMGMVLIPKEGQLDKLNEELDKITKKEAIVYTHSSIESQLIDAIGSINVVLKIVILVIVLVLSISVGSLIYIIYLNRSEEFGILYAMGYKMSFITGRIISELVFLASACWGIGFLLSMGMINLLNALLLNDKGLTIPAVTYDGTINTLFIPVLIVFCAALPILRKLRKWDPIAIIERRD